MRDADAADAGSFRRLMTRDSDRARGLTLLELLIAVSLFAILGTLLTAALGTGADAWRKTEKRRASFERGQIILERIEDDLVNLAAPPTGTGGPVLVRLLVDLDANRRYRLRFVRTIKAEDEIDAFRFSGSGAPGEFNQVFDRMGGAKDRLKPLGGLMEVAYLMDPDPDSDVLYRGVLSPIGGSLSLFNDENVDTTQDVRKRCSPVSSGVLYLGFKLWTQYTETWNLEAPISREIGGGGGPVPTWDSTLGAPMGSTPSLSRRRAAAAAGAGISSSSEDSVDDVIPRRIQIELTAAGEEGEPMTFLSSDLSRSARRIHVESAEGFPVEDDASMLRFLRVGGEWIHYEKRDPYWFHAGDGRGARGTKASSHRADAPVWGGRTFILSVEIPAERVYWEGEELYGILERHAPDLPEWAKIYRQRKGR